MLPRYYDLLSLPPNATVDDVRVARETLLAKYQPHATLGDRDAIRLVQAIEDAATTLTDPSRRAAYDAALAVVLAPVAPSPQPSSRQPDRGPSTTPLLTPPSSGHLTTRPAVSWTSQPQLPPPPTDEDKTPSPPTRALATKPKTDPGGPPAPILFLLLILDWLAKRALELKDGAGHMGEVLGRPAAPALPPPGIEGVKVSAADWQFVVHDAFFTSALAINGQRLTAHGYWLLVRLGIRNEWGGHRALRAEDFALMMSRPSPRPMTDAYAASEIVQVPLHLEATHAARLTLGLKATPAGRHGLGFAAAETKETVLVFEMSGPVSETYLRLKPTGALVDLAPIAPFPWGDGQSGVSSTIVEGRTASSRTTTLAPRLEILDIHLGVGRGRSRQVTVTARATPGAVCHIRVQYARGPSAARGLEPAIAGPDGLVSWTWRITPRTRPGEWPVMVVCGYTHALGSIIVDPHPDF